MGEWYRLDGRTVVPVAAPWENASTTRQSCWQRIAETHVKHVRISTVFLGLDHNHGGGIPLVFETMVFEGQLDQEQVRYHTYDEAEAGHAHMVERVQEVEMSEIERAVRDVRKER